MAVLRRVKHFFHAFYHVATELNGDQMQPGAGYEQAHLLVLHIAAQLLFGLLPLRAGHSLRVVRISAR